MKHFVNRIKNLFRCNIEYVGMGGNLIVIDCSKISHVIYSGNYVTIYIEGREIYGMVNELVNVLGQFYRRHNQMSK